jgi:heat shock protein HslJ
MSRRTSHVGLLALLALTFSQAGAVVAQDEAATPEDQTWTLAAYAVASDMAALPEDVIATLMLADGVASGSTGCNQFSASYALDGASLSFEPQIAQTMMACDRAAQSVEDAYLSLLPATAAWQSSGTMLQLTDAEGAVLLEYAPAGPDLATAIALIEQLRAEVSELRARVDALEATTGAEGDAAGEATSTGSTPTVPRARGSVETTFPAWMREGLPPEQVDDRNREVVRWRDRADDEAGYRVYARRGYCELRPGTDVNQPLDDGDFRRARTAAVLIDELPAGTTRYRPDHVAIDDALPAAPDSPYSNDQFYDLSVAAYSDAGESRKVLVGSFYLTPEFRCP